MASAFQRNDVAGLVASASFGTAASTSLSVTPRPTRGPENGCGWRRVGAGSRVKRDDVVGLSPCRL